MLFSRLIGFSQGIEFRSGSWEEIKEIAQKENKLIFLDAYTSWCGPCKWMEKNTFLDAQVGDFYNKNVIAFKQDMEKGEGPMLSKKFGVTQYPTYMFIDSKENVVHKGQGAKQPDVFIEFGKQALDPKLRLEGLKEQYKEGKRDPEFIRRYLFALRDAGENGREVLAWYFNYMSDENMLTSENYEVIKKLASNPYSKKFIFLEKNRSKYEQLVGKDEVKKTLYEAYNVMLVMAMYSGDTAQWERAKERARTSGFEDASLLITKVSIYYYNQYKQWDAYVKTINDYISNYEVSAGDMGYYALQVAKNESITGKDQLHMALNWVNKSIGMESNYRNNHAKAALLLKMGKQKQALKTAENALLLATDEEKQKEYTKPTFDLIEKIKAQKN